MNTLLDKYRLRKSAFTLVEVMLLLVVLSLVFASSAAVITRKHKLRPRKSVHGTYICYRDNTTGALHEAMYSGKSTVKADTIVEECTFDAPQTATYLYLQLIGGGGAGGNANQPGGKITSGGPYPTDGHLSGYFSGLDDTNPDYDAIYTPTAGYPDGKRLCSQIPDENDKTAVEYYKTYCQSGGKPVTSTLSFIRNMDASDYPAGIAVGNKQGLTLNDIHKLSWMKKTFSAKSLFKFFKDNDIKFMVYDYAGSGGSGKDVRFEYLTFTDEERDYDNNYHWYKSLCFLGSPDPNDDPEKNNASKCMDKLLKLTDAREVAPILNKTDSFKFGGRELNSYGSVINFLEGKDYCQFRYPLYKNCPILRSVYVPQRTSKYCRGQKGGAPGIFSSDSFIPLGLNYTYKLGKRFKYRSGSNWLVDSSNTIDFDLVGYVFDCVVQPQRKDDLFWTDKQIIPVKNIGKGTFLTAKDSCTLIPGKTDSYRMPCKSEAGLEMQFPKDINNYYIPSETSTTGVAGSTIIASGWYHKPDGSEDSVGGSLLSRYFKTYPTADYDLRLEKHSGCIYTPGYNETGAGLTQIAGDLYGKDGGLPYFGETPDAGDKGLKLCKGASCTLYGVNGSGNLVYNTNAIVQTYKSSKGGAPAKAKANYIQWATFTTNPSVEDPCITETLPDAQGSTVTWKTQSGKYDICSRNVAIRMGSSVEKLKLGAFHSHSASADSLYKCPISRSSYSETSDRMLDQNRETRWGDIGLALGHYTGTMQLYYGEKGYAGNYKSMFSRSFGSAKLLMNPGKGGIAYAGTNTQDVDIKTGNVRNTTNEYGRAGSSTIFGTDCTLKEGGNSSNGDDYECAIKLEAPGGSGGRSHLQDDQEMVLFSNEDLMKLIRDGDKTHLTRYSSNYDPADVINSKYNGELSGFQEVSYLSDLSFLDNGDFLANLGRGGNGAYVEHKCFLRPQYFVYNPSGFSRNVNITNADAESGLYILENATRTSDYWAFEGDSSLPEWEGYVALTQSAIDTACSDYETVVPAGKRPKAYNSSKVSTNKFIETDPTDGYPGAVVIMW